MVTAASVDRGYVNFKVSEVGHGTSKIVSNEKIVATNSTHHQIIYTRGRDLVMKELCDALTELGFDELEVFEIHDNSRVITTKKKKKDGTCFDPFLSTPSHLWVDFTRNFKDIRVMMDHKKLKIGIHDGNDYKYYRNAANVKRLIKEK